jgi:hypothetical protein
MAGDQGNRFDYTAIQGGNYGGIYIPTVTGSADNTDKPTIINSLQPNANDPGEKTEWDVTSLDSAIAWLTAHADYLVRMYHGMDDLKTLMDGPKLSNDVMQHSGTNGQSGGPLGGFPWALKLAERQSNLFQGFNTSLKTVAENLYDAADALRKVKDKYHDVEGANAMSAAEMESDFTEAQSQVSSHNI